MTEQLIRFKHHRPWITGSCHHPGLWPKRFGLARPTPQGFKQRLGCPARGTLRFEICSIATAKGHCSHGLQPPGAITRLPEQHQHRTGAALEEIDLMAEATARRIKPQAGLAAGTLKLPASAASVVTLPVDGIGGLPSRSEGQTGTIPNAMVYVTEANGISGGINHPLRRGQIQPIRAITPKPGAGSLPTAGEIASIQHPLIGHRSHRESQQTSLGSSHRSRQ